MKKIGVLTSGGDSPGMNAAVVSVARSAALYGMPLVGIKRGYNGLLRKQARMEDDLIEMPLDLVLDIADNPGTYLRTARCLEFLDPVYRQKAVDTLKEMDIVGLVVIGIPGTIDNDLPYTEMTLGYDTAVNVCVDAVRSIRATSRSHDRAAVVEVMGRHCGDIALSTAVSTGAEIVIVPEVRWSVEDVARRLNELIARGNTRATVVAAEGCWASMKPFNSYEYLKSQGVEIWKKNRMDARTLALVLRHMCPTSEARATVLGYTQRGPQPTARDATFAFEAGNTAVTLLRDGIGNQVIGRKKGKVFHMDIEKALKEKRHFNKRMYDLVNTL